MIWFCNALIYTVCIFCLAGLQVNSLYSGLRRFVGDAQMINLRAEIKENGHSKRE
jgi:hypothetical protein